VGLDAFSIARPFDAGLRCTFLKAPRVCNFVLRVGRKSPIRYRILATPVIRRSRRAYKDPLDCLSDCAGGAMIRCRLLAFPPPHRPLMSDGA